MVRTTKNIFRLNFHRLVMSALWLSALSRVYLDCQVVLSFQKLDLPAESCLDLAIRTIHLVGGLGPDKIAHITICCAIAT